MNIQWPAGFYWGTATSAHQVEGGNYNTDWWAWEHDPDSPCTEPSVDACDHYHRYPEDIALLAKLGFNAYRFSIEWARIEPEEGEVSRAQLEHYRRMIGTCREHGLAPVVTLHHFTSPRWVASAGGWEDPATADRFARYCEHVAAHLGEDIEIACTINEPNMPALHGFQTGVFPPGKRDRAARDRATDTFVAAHRRAVDALKGGPGDALVGMTLAMTDYQPVDGGEAKLEQIRARTEDVFLDAAKGDDFFGVQTYSRNRVSPEGVLPPEEGMGMTMMGYEFYPEALEATIRRAAAVLGDAPLIVTENGIATSDDTERIRFVTTALEGMGRCLDEGLDVRGYFYWSALDNFEWTFGYGPTFGLVAVDRATQERTAKPSARWLGGIARAGE